MNRLLKILLIILLLPLAAEGAKPKKRSSSDAQSQRRKTEQQMKQTSKKLTMTEAEIKQRLGKINTLQQKIGRSENNSIILKRRLDSIALRSARVQDSIKANEAELARLRQLYTSAVRSSRRNRREMNTLTFIFSADNFRQAYRRMRYLEQYSAWRQRKTDQIGEVVASLEAQKAELADMAKHTASLRSQEIAEQRHLKSSRDSVNSVVKSLQGQKKKLNSMLKEQQKTISRLDDEISRLIAQEAEEQRRREAAEAKRRAEEAARKAAQADAQKPGATPAPADKKKPAESKPKQPEFQPDNQSISNSTGEFAARKGKLPSPLSHTYVVARPFGVQPHKTHTHVEVNNPGLDLETALGATARAVHPGFVSAVFVQDGFGHVVLVRHGSYLTVYANVKTINVKKGDKLKAGDVIGTVAPSEFNPSRGMLHFEIRREREKFDPQQWLKR